MNSLADPRVPQLPLAQLIHTRLGNMRVRLRGIKIVRRYRTDRSCVLYHYHRASGIPLKGLPGSPEFIESLAAAERSLRERAKGTISDLIRKFENSPAFDRAESTKAEYRRKFRIIERDWGEVPISSFTSDAFARDVIHWRDAIAMRGAKREADNLLSALSRLASWAIECREIKENALEGIKRVYEVDRSDKLWLPEHVQLFRRQSSPEMETALLLAMHTGQRQGDLRRLAWSAYDGERITLIQGKRKRRVSIRCTAALKAHLDRLERRGLLVLLTPKGKSWTKRYFNQKWDEAYQASGIDAGLHFHDLRGTAVTMLAEAGCTVPEIAAITGHSLKDATAILEVYLSRTRDLADAGIIKLDAYVNRFQKP